MSLTDAEIEAILDMEAMALPDGETRNFENPPNENGLAMAIITITLVVGTVCVLLRGYARLYLLRKVQIEESKSTHTEHGCLPLHGKSKS